MSMNVDEIKALIDAMGSSDLAEMEVAKDGWTLRLVRHPASVSLAPPGIGPKPPAAPTIGDGARDARIARDPIAPPDLSVRAPLSGIVYLSPSPDAAPFVIEGQSVEPGAILCTIEAMKTFNEIRAEHGGTVAAILVTAGAEVEAGQPLVRIR